MTKFFFILSTGILIFSSVMTLVMAVVVFLYWLHLDLEPTMEQTWPVLTASVWLFSGLTVGWGASALALYKRHWSRWPLTVIAVMIMAFVFVAFGQVLGL